MAKHVFSTLSADTRYTGTEKAPGGMVRVTRSVLIRGGAGVALRGAGQQVLTLSGVRTEVSDSDAEFLANHGVFKEQMERGFLRIEPKALDPEKVADRMEGNDPSKPKTPADVQEDAAAAAAKTGLSAEETLQVVTNKKK